MTSPINWRLAAVALTVIAHVAVGGTRMFLVPKGMDPELAVPGTSVVVETAGGELVVLEVYVEWTPPDRGARAFAVTMPCGNNFSIAGSAPYQAPPVVDLEHPSYFYPELCPCPVDIWQDTCEGAPDFTGTPPTWMPWLCEGLYCVAVQSYSPLYVGEITYAPSPDASGFTVIDFPNVEWNGVWDAFSQPILPLSTDGVEIRVTHGRCCAAEDACAEMTRFECDLIEGLFAEGESCAGLACGPIRLIGSDPPNCAIDARQPHAISDPEVRFGWNRIDLFFNGGSESLSADDLEVIEIGGDGVPPQIAAVDPIGLGANRARLTSIIEPGAWTCIRHVASDTQACVAALPGDVNGDRTAGPVDVLGLIDALNGVVNPPLELWQTDIDRSGAATPADVLRLIDLLNGAEAFDPWLLSSLPECPG